RKSSSNTGCMRAIASAWFMGSPSNFDTRRPLGERLGIRFEDRTARVLFDEREAHPGIEVANHPIFRRPNVLAAHYRGAPTPRHSNELVDRLVFDLSLEDAATHQPGVDLNQAI